jgi:hypothetical protein
MLMHRFLPEYDIFPKRQNNKCVQQQAQAGLVYQRSALSATPLFFYVLLSK